VQRNRSETGEVIGQHAAGVDYVGAGAALDRDRRDRRAVSRAPVGARCH